MFHLSRRHLLVSLPLLSVSHRAFAAPVNLEIWKMRGCACCEGWARYFVYAGFATQVHELDDLNPIRMAAGVPPDLGGCHTARIDGYVIEGHVPLAAVQRLLRERPALVGLAVPGMPLGSPGMESAEAEPFDVVAFAADGSRSVFMQVQP